MSVVCRNQGQVLNYFDEYSSKALLVQLDKDAAFQKRIKIIATIASLILFAGGVVTAGVCIAGIVPYSLLFTMLVVGGTGCAALSLMSLAALKECGYPIIAYCTSLPICYNLKQEIHSRGLITGEASCEYIKKFLDEYAKKLEEESRQGMNELLINRQRIINGSSSDFSHVTDIALEYF